MTRLSPVVVLSVALASAISAQTPTANWPQWRGVNRDGVITSFTEPKVWPETLTQRWKVPVGLGYATPVVIGDRLFMFSRVDGNETLRAMDAATGKTIWQTAYPAPFRMNPAAARHGEGPKATPTFANGKLYTLGMTNIVSAFDAATGKQVWQTKATDAQPLYHTSQSPLVERGLVIVHIGGHNQGTLNAYDMNTGAVKWSWNGDGPSYGSPIAVDAGGTRQIVLFSQEAFVGIDVASGALLWKRPFSTRATQNTITPLVYGGLILFSGLDKPVTAARIVRKGNDWALDDVWENSEVSLYMSNAVLVGDSLCGLSNRNSGQFFCLDARTGKTQWLSPPRQATNASVLSAGRVWFALTSDAELFVFHAGATTFEPVKRYTVADSATWAAPSVVGNRMFVKDVNTLALWSW